MISYLVEISARMPLKLKILVSTPRVFQKIDFSLICKCKQMEAVYGQYEVNKNTPGTRGWSRLPDRTLPVKSRKNARKICFFSRKIIKFKWNIKFLEHPNSLLIYLIHCFNPQQCGFGQWSQKNIPSFTELFWLSEILNLEQLSSFHWA